MPLASNKSLCVISREEAQRRLGIGRSTFYAFCNENSPSFKPSFPKRVRQGGLVGFIEHEVDDYVRSLMQAREVGR
ncbi:TPA: helix-turn-helix transcriptional regulator [Stenotrophomonas maltophilia]|uniref:helix-turn-helix transcriptional regulator n=1 Tax=Stenotrophomonas maltophilia TaxID=40324 RepID=UPI0015DDD190|nr:AlpA family phage regulatory protein [Stenotrophomonas maltophilia]MBA0235696.1 AlpA family phage regulatory protein [Stenotrophomonas maltophilia]MBA0269653.1 AlpA family phage regulatory protein [Stenotrophomonas maltophilia]MBN7829202.1 AlpA family phage regulatory protein [Stenotrophomonas maltophilia]MBN7832952.1 AlpA family phage regulatory protein [Stenotrophomonas maltophilia]MBN7857290.1 AlpA family phage regulatory protein [Stenotrophomonas maltophilia]